VGNLDSELRKRQLDDLHGPHLSNAGVDEAEAGGNNEVAPEQAGGAAVAQGHAKGAACVNSSL
jgi:hypothetical protein